MDLFYRWVRWTGGVIVWAAVSPLVLHGERGRMRGGFLLASNHQTPFDIPCLMYTTRRRIDFVSIVELMRRPLVGTFFHHLNAISLDRGRVDAGAVRTIVGRLKRGRVVCLFPEGRLTPGPDSVIHGGPFRKGLGRMAVLAGVPVVPCVIVGTAALTKWTAWLPGSRTRWVVAYGQPIHPPAGVESKEAQRQVEAAWQAAMRRLHDEVEAARDGHM